MIIGRKPKRMKPFCPGTHLSGLLLMQGAMGRRLSSTSKPSLPVATQTTKELRKNPVGSVLCLSKDYKTAWKVFACLFV